MAHRNKHKLRLSAPEPEPTTLTTDPSSKNHYSSAAAAAAAYSGHHLSNAVRSRLHTATHKVRKPTVDTHFQAKPLNVSADFEPSKNKISHPIEEQQRKKTEVPPRQLPEKGGVEDDEIVKKLDSLLLEKEKEPRKSTGEVDARRRSSGSLAVAAGGRRRSFGGLQVELADVFASSGVKIVSVDMPPFMQIHAVDCARKTCDSLEKFTCKTLALTLKKEFDGVYGPAWHCIVGKSFGSFVTHSVGGFMYFSIDQKMHILLFKTTVQKTV